VRVLPRAPHPANALDLMKVRDRRTGEVGHVLLCRHRCLHSPDVAWLRRWTPA